MKKIQAVFRVVRPHQWVKNAFVFLPLFFNGALFNSDKFVVTVAAFFAFSFAASAIYCLNDIMDIEADRSHPKKCNRPLASGILSKSFGWVMMGFLFVLSALTEYFCGGGILRMF